MTADFSTLPQIVKAPFLFKGFTAWPTYAPDGQSIVFTNDADSLNCYLVMLDLSENNTKKLTSPKLGAKRPSFHPNGKAIAYNVNNETIWLFNLENDSSELYITEDLRANRKLIHPCFAPDGRSIVVASFQRNGPQREEVLYRISPNSFDQLTTYPEVCAGRPSISPDNATVVFAGHEGSFNQLYNRLWVVNEHSASFPLESGSKTAVHGRCPAFSPDGKWIACVSGRPEQSFKEDSALSVWIIKNDGKQAYKLTDNSNKPTHMSWSPDQKQLAVTGAKGLQLIPLPEIFNRVE